ncbi:DNA-binding protein [uncultured Bacteroides sp.]|uniref:HU family DNA-binding protein n=1 Tax=uncultured Bacteroides sp. TaxID=162156 RepID=UPI0025F9E861|nr:DNA-binding protein [uncultured Bacteroides sp.]
MHKKWYITQVTTAQMGETQVAMDLADETTLNPSEAMMAIRQLRKILLRRLLGGESVKLGNWGSFSISVSSLGVNTKEEVNARNIKGINLNFLPDEAFKTDLQKATYAWVDKLAEGRTHSDPDGGKEEPDGGGETPNPQRNLSYSKLFIRADTEKQ